MTDLEDVVKAVVDIEDIVEEIAEPDELLADFVENPLMIVFAFVAGGAALFALLLFLLTVLLFVLAVGPVQLLALLTVVSFVMMGLAIGAFLYLQTDIPSHVQQKITAALEQADNTSPQDASMTEEEAISEIKTQYAKGKIKDHELDAVLEETLTSDDPEKVVEQYR